MRIVHSRKKVKETDSIFSDKISILTWILSALHWKKFGKNSLIMYTDKETLKSMKEFYIDTLYDEINTSLLESDVCENIDFKYFWATSKLLAYKKEIELGYNPIISDTDIIPMSGMYSWNATDCVVCSKKESLAHPFVYPMLERLSLPEGYTLPSWFTGRVTPLCTGVLYFRNQKNASEYLENALSYIINNKNPKNNSATMTMCNAEQRMLAEFLNYKKLRVYPLQKSNEGIFNKTLIHTHGYKDFLKRLEMKNTEGISDYILLWSINMLLMIRKSNILLFRKLIKKEQFSKEREYFNKNGYTAEVIEELRQYSDLF